MTRQLLAEVLLRRIDSLEAQVASLQAEVVRLGAENARLQAVISTCRKQKRPMRHLFAHRPVSPLARG